MGETSIRSWLAVVMAIIGLNMVDPVLVIVKANNASISCPFPSAIPPCLVLRSPLNDGEIKKKIYQKRGRFGKSGTFKYCIKFAKKHCNKKAASSNENYKNCFSRALAECMGRFLSRQISPQL